jgi:lipopolysaccharide biosynthesis glycosyltransferase
VNLLFCIDRSFVPLLQSCLKSIIKNGGAEHYDAYLLHSDLTEEDERMMESTFSAVTFHFIPIDEALFRDFPEFKRYPLQIYYRLATPLFLPKELDRILYLDVDTVVINSLVPLYESSFDGAYFMACTHTRKLLTKLNQLRLGMDNDAPYINSGVMMINLAELREHFSMEEIRRFAEEKRERLLLPDQDIITALYGDRVKLLDSMIYNLSDRTLNFYNADPDNEPRDLDWVRQNSVVIHYFGRNKPWKEHYHGVLDVFYQEVQA